MHNNTMITGWYYVKRQGPFEYGDRSKIEENGVRMEGEAMA